MVNCTTTFLQNYFSDYRGFSIFCMGNGCWINKIIQWFTVIHPDDLFCIHDLATYYDKTLSTRYCSLNKYFELYELDI